ncbi:MAG TPA: hypothetical protein VL523_13985 [Terriglobia bacterium]|nr:hypothetical protein [Terriglobia bacterium]
MSRSALVRGALREHLRRIHVQELEAQDRRVYLRHPDDAVDVEAWEQVAAWPEE